MAVNYKNGKVLSEIVTLASKYNLQYYINSAGVVLTKWNDVWTPWHIVMQDDKRLMLENV